MPYVELYVIDVSDQHQPQEQQPQEYLPGSPRPSDKGIVHEGTYMKPSPGALKFNPWASLESKRSQITRTDGMLSIIRRKSFFQPLKRLGEWFSHGFFGEPFPEDFHAIDNRPTRRRQINPAFLGLRNLEEKANDINHHS